MNSFEQHYLQYCSTKYVNNSDSFRLGHLKKYSAYCNTKAYNFLFNKTFLGDFQNQVLKFVAVLSGLSSADGDLSLPA